MAQLLVFLYNWKKSEIATSQIKLKLKEYLDKWCNNEYLTNLFCNQYLNLQRKVTQKHEKI